MMSIDSKITAAFSKLESSDGFVSFELTPLVGAQVLAQDTLDELKSCALFDSFVCTDSPLARFKPSSVLSSIALQSSLQTPLICTLAMRDKNTAALCGEILGANAFSLRAFLSLTGDPIKLGNTQAKAVFEDNSTKLNAIISSLNAGCDLLGKPLKSAPNRIYNCNVINSYAINSKTIESKIIKKIKSAFIDSSSQSLSALFSQPAYSLESAHALLDSLESANRTLGTKVPLVLGFFPVTSYKSAVFLRDKLPGVFIPESWILRLERAHKSPDPNEEEKVGLELSRELFHALSKIHNKFHFMTNNNLSLAQKILLH